MTIDPPTPRGTPAGWTVVTATPKEPGASGQSCRQRLLVPVLVLVALVVALVSSLGAPLVPTVAEVNHISLTSAQWSLTIALLVGAVATPVMGRLADGPRRRHVILVTLALVTVGSALAALSLGFAYLLAGRALQGAGLGLAPVTIAVAREQLLGDRVRSAIALLSITTVAGVGVGYTLTGLITEHLGLHAAFWLGTGVGALAFFLAALVIPPNRHAPDQSLDMLGVLLFGASLAGLLLCLSEAERWGWTSAPVLSVAAASVAVGGVWVHHELRAAYPLVDLRLFLSRPVLTASITALLGGVGVYLFISLSTRLVQTPPSTGYGHGASVAVAGLVLVPFSVAGFVASRVVPRVTRNRAADALLPLGCLVLLAAMLAFATFSESLWQVFLVMGGAGLGVGIAFAAIPALIVHAVPEHRTGSAMSVNQVLRTVGFSLGSALSATVLEAHTPHGERLPTADGYDAAAVIGCGVWVAMLLLTTALRRADQ